MTKLTENTSIWLTTEISANKKSMPIRIDNYLLDLYSLKKYHELYSEVKARVNDDIREISKEINSTTVRDIKAHIIMSIATKTIMKRVKNIYT